MASEAALKKKQAVIDEIKERMHKCAEDIHALDQKMLKLNDEMQVIKDDQEII